MLLRRRTTEPIAEENSFEEYAWKTQRALSEWTAKVDTKASIMLTLETAAFGAVLAFSSDTGKPLAHLGGVAVWFYRAGVSLLVCGILCAGAAVFPQLNRRDARRNWRSNFLYFGHLRQWPPERLIAAVTGIGTDQEDIVLSTQIVAVAKIVWRKHALIQWSMSLTLLSGAALGLSALLR